MIKNNPYPLHNLCRTDVRTEDKMNVDSAKKICTEAVQQLLPTEASGTKLYLKVMRDCLMVFEENSFTIEQRVLILSRVIYVLRIWKKSIEEKNLSLNEFISIPCYQCIELNFHTFISFIMYCRENSVEYLLQYLFHMSSQECEYFFRTLRSISTALWTAVNFSPLDIIYKVRRLNAGRLADMSLNKIEGFVVPRKREVKLHVHSVVPSDDEILKIFEQARIEAFEICSHVGIKLLNNTQTYLNFVVKETNTKSQVDKSINKTTNSSLNSPDDFDLLQKYCTSIADNLTTINTSENKFFILKSEDNGSIFKIRKTTFIRLLNEKIVISKDRNKRFLSNISKQKEKTLQHKNMIAVTDLISIKNFDGVCRIMDFQKLDHNGKR